MILDRWGIKTKGRVLFTQGRLEEFDLQLSHSGKKSVLELQDEVFSERPPTIKGH